MAQKCRKFGLLGLDKRKTSLKIKEMGEEVLFAVKEKSYFGFRTNYYLDSDYTVKHRLNGPAVEWDDGSY